MPLLPNQDDVLYRGRRSFNYDFAHEPAVHTSTATSGGASVNYNSEGIQLNVGATAGDSGTLLLENLGQFRSGTLERTIVYQTRGTTPPYTDTYKLGFNNDSSGQEIRSAYLDFENEVYSVNGTTAPATLPGNYQGCYLEIVVDIAGRETTFIQRGNVNEEVTINSGARQQGTLIDATSNGAGDDSFRVAKAPSTIIPPQ